MEMSYWLTEMGIALLPYSFAIYFPVRWLEHVWQSGYTRAVKATWYFTLGLSYFGDQLEPDVIVVYICFIEAWDLLFEQRMLSLNRREKTSAGTRNS